LKKIGILTAFLLNEQAAQIILDGKGIHFDSHIIEAFVLLRNTFKEIA
jgi:response regulator RpfG family c-di-GMP phosphodiesterase